MRVAIISRKRIQQASIHCELLNSAMKFKLITTPRIRPGGRETLGVAKTHLFLTTVQQTLLALDDDIVLTDGRQLKMAKRIHPGAGMVLLGCNLDSVLRRIQPLAGDNQPV